MNFDPGISAVAVFDCTVPGELCDRFNRAPFQEIQVIRFFPDWTGA